jgi:hypothetical protein
MKKYALCVIAAAAALALGAAPAVADTTSPSWTR